MWDEGGPGPMNGAGDGESPAEESDESATDERQETRPQATSTCATCWRQIPPDRVRCPHCFGSAGADEVDPEAWSYDRIVVATLPAEGAGDAKASAVTAFERGRSLVSGPDNTHGEVTLYAAVESPLPDELTEEWPELSGAVPVTSSAGQSLFETAAARCEGSTDPVIYCEDGAPVADGDEVETLAVVIEDADVSYWVVPGIVKRYQLPDEPDAFGDPLYCADCGAVTEHDRVEEDRADRPEGGVLTCRVCGTQRRGPD